MRAIPRDRLVLLLIVLSIVGILLLYGYAVSLRGREMSIGEISADDIGMLVSTKGLIKSSWTTGEGSFNMIILDQTDYATIRVFLPASAYERVEEKEELIPGASVRVEGEVQEYRGELEIYVASPEGVKLLNSAGSEEIPIETIARNPAAFDGMLLTVKGEFSSPSVVVDFDRVEIRDAGVSLWALVDKYVEVGEGVDVYGKLMYNEMRERYELKISSEQDGIFPSPSSPPDGYTSVSLVEVVQNPSAYENMLLTILNVDTERGELIGTRFTLSDIGEMDRYSVEGMIFGWNYELEDRNISSGDAVRFTGTFGYYEQGARWQISSDEFTLQRP